MSGFYRPNLAHVARVGGNPEGKLDFGPVVGLYFAVKSFLVHLAMFVISRPNSPS